MTDWHPYTLPNLEEPNIPLHDLTEWLSSLPGHPEPLTPHHTAHELAYQPGANVRGMRGSDEWGRGLVDHNNQVYTWPEDQGEHYQQAQRVGMPGADDPWGDAIRNRSFTISPDGQFTMHPAADVAGGNGDPWTSDPDELVPHIQQTTGLTPDPYYHPDPMNRQAGTEEICPHCQEVHAEDEKCPMLYGETFTMPPPPGDKTGATYPPPNGTHTCPGCGQGTVSNGWTGWTPMTNGEAGPRSWNCPTCGVDHRSPLGRPELQPGQGRY